MYFNVVKRFFITQVVIVLGEVIGKYGTSVSPISICAIACLCYCILSVLFFILYYSLGNKLHSFMHAFSQSKRQNKISCFCENKYS